MGNKGITQLSIQSLLSDESVEYRIPMYQRNYAWEEGEINQLIQDVIDYMDKDQNYYIGTLVVYRRKEVQAGHTIYETIDGQQRLTTLTLIAIYLKTKGLTKKEGLPEDWFQKANLRFENRKNSQDTLEAIFNNPHATPKDGQAFNSAILNGYQLIEKNLRQKNKEELAKFAKFLFERVQIMRVEVPEGTDLNHYFEIMNSRGEQLEKHEVLKARLLEKLQGDTASENCLHTVWEACANMDRYVQMGFFTAQRSEIFGNDWNQFSAENFDGLCSRITKGATGNKDGAAPQSKLSEIIKPEFQKKAKDNGSAPDKNEGAPERFKSVTSFPFFLLHVLRVSTQENIPLDDKGLLDTFKEHLLKGEDKVFVAERVKKFIFDLLKCKFLFDQFVIKRAGEGEEDWSLMRLKKYGGDNWVKADYENTFKGDKQKNTLMLLAAFHVSTPTLAYKYWLDAALKYLFDNADMVKPDEYQKYLESVAKAFMFDRFLAADNGADYYTMIYKNGGECRTLSVSDETLQTKLSYGGIENNFVFNYLDYLLWKKEMNKSESVQDKKIWAFKFKFRSSVEHYYPQNPLSDPWKSEPLNSFGNLCLISHSKNSKLSNRIPREKKMHYDKQPDIDSVKQCLMMRGDEEWNEKSVESHYKAMCEVLLAELKCAT